MGFGVVEFLARFGCIRTLQRGRGVVRMSGGRGEQAL